MAILALVHAEASDMRRPPGAAGIRRA